LPRGPLGKAGSQASGIPSCDWDVFAQGSRTRWFQKKGAANSRAHHPSPGGLLLVVAPRSWLLGRWRSFSPGWQSSQPGEELQRAAHATDGPPKRGLQLWCGAMATSCTTNSGKGQENDAIIGMFEQRGQKALESAAFPGWT